MIIIPPKIPWGWWIPVLFSLSIVGVACQPAYTFNGTHLEPAKPLNDFELTTSGGQPFHLNDYNGDITLIYFGYTFCPDVCPLTMADVKTALKDLDVKRDRVHVVFITVDPERDTPELLEQYVSAFDPTYIAVTGTPENIEVAKDIFGVFSEKDEEANTAADYLVNHTSRVFLIDPQGDLALLYSFGFAPEDLRSDLTHLLRGL